jgi:hypothetical protein
MTTLVSLAPRAQTILARLNRVARRMRSTMLTQYRPDSCVVATRALIDALAHFGVRAMPLVARALVLSPAVAQALREYNPQTLRVPEILQLCEQMGGWSVGVGWPDVEVPGHWEGHLVTLIEGTRVVDLTLDQASRPMRDIRLEPVAVDIDPLTIEQAGSFSLNCRGSLVCYHAFPADRTYEDLHDWVTPPVALANTFIRLLEHECTDV